MFPLVSFTSLDNASQTIQLTITFHFLGERCIYTGPVVSFHCMEGKLTFTYFLPVVVTSNYLHSTYFNKSLYFSEKYDKVQEFSYKDCEKRSRFKRVEGKYIFILVMDS